MNIKRWILLAVGLLTLSVSCLIYADDKFVSKDGLYEYELKKEYGDKGTYYVADLINYLGKDKIVRVPESIDGYQVCYLTGTFNDDFVTKVYLPETDINVTYPFAGNSKIKEIEIAGNGFHGTGIFAKCNSLKKAKASGCKTDDGKGFIGLPEFLETLELSGEFSSLCYRESDYIKEIIIKGSVYGLSFFKCTQLETITLPENTMNIYDNCFKYCYNLKTINYDGSLCQWKNLIKGIDNTGLTNVTVNCSKQDTHSYGTSVIVKKATCKEEGMKQTVCKNCGYTITEKIPVSKTHSYGEWKIIKDATFTSAGSQERTCSVCGKKETKSIKKLVLKAGLIFEDPASGCKYKVLADKSKICCLAPLNKKVVSISIPDTVSYKGVKFKAAAIGNKAFSQCSDLVIINIGKNIGSIGSYAFSNCNMLCRIYLKSTVLTKVGKKALTGTDSDLVIRVPKKKLTAYKKLFDKKGQSKDTKIQGVA